MDFNKMPRGRGRSLTLAAATPQHPVRQPINARSDSMGFGVIGSGMRTANVRMPAGSYNTDRSVGLEPAQRVAHSMHTANNMSGPSLMQAEGMLLGYSGHAQQHNGADQQFALDTNGMVRHLFATSGVHENPGHRRTYTPTKEQLALSLSHLGLVAGDNATIAADILDTAQRRLERSMDRRDANNGPGLSDTFSVSKDTETFGEPRTPAVPVSGFGCSPPKPTNQGQLMANELYSGCSDNNLSRSGHPMDAGRIDPYIPTDHGFFAQGPDGNSVWIGMNNQADHSQAVAGNGRNRFCGTANGTQIAFCLPSNQPSAASSGRDSDNALKLENEQLNPDADDLERQAHRYQSNLSHACDVAVKYITVREAEIASLRRQLRQEGLRPYNEPEDTEDDAFYEKELSMLFRMLSCWAKRFYKFPTTETLGEDLMNKLLQVCEDWHNECYLMISERTKSLVVVAMATRMLAGLFEPDFLDEVVSDFLRNPAEAKAGDGLREIIRSAKLGNPEYDDRIYEAFQKVAGKKAEVFLTLIRPLMSRMTDKTHSEQTHKQFVQVAQHAARIVFEAAKKGAAFSVQFFHFGERFSADTMKDVTADNLGSDIAAKMGSLLLELRGARIRICMLPHITVSIAEMGNAYRQIEASKANVLLF